MYNLLSINGTEMPNIDKGSISVSLEDVYNTYKAENGHSTIESVRTGRFSASVSYKGLLAEDIVKVKNAINLVSTVVMYDPTSDTLKTFTAKVSKLKTKKVAYFGSVSAWSLSFDVEEL